jgi:hypothetical protein
MTDIELPTPADNDEALGTLGEFDLSLVMGACIKSYGWSPAQASDAETWYRRHLELCILYPDLSIAVLSKNADLVWHQHIVDTRRYRADCDEIFGHFLDHTPYYGDGSLTEEAKRIHELTLALYKRQFGVSPADPQRTSAVMRPE